MILKSKQNMIVESKLEKIFIKDVKNESGFSLIEVIIALLILLVSVFGIFSTLTFATVYNRGNSQRSQALSVLQQEVELLRSKKFTPTILDPELSGGIKTARTVTSADGFKYTVEVAVDDDPFTANTPNPQINTAKTLKEITIKVTPQSVTGGWVTAVPTSVVFRRVRAN